MIKKILNKNKCMLTCILKAGYMYSHRKNLDIWVVLQYGMAIEYSSTLLEDA